MRFVFALVLGLSAAAAHAQAFPSKPIRFVVPFPGGFSDVLARQIGSRMGEALGQPIVVENRPGGSGQIGAQEVIRSPADGHTLFMGHIGTHAINAHIFPKLNYDPDKDIAPVTLLVTVPNLLVVHPSVPAQNVRELIALAKSKPGGLSYASPGSAPNRRAGASSCARSEFAPTRRPCLSRIIERLPLDRSRDEEPEPDRPGAERDQQ